MRHLFQTDPAVSLPYRRGSIKSIIWLMTALALLLQGCSFRPIRPAPGSDQAPVFLPPTQVSVVTPQMTGIPAEPSSPTPTLPCEDNLTYISDLTIPDGTSVQPGATLDKRWEVRNSGTCNWDKRYQLRLIAGDRLGVNEQLALFPARSGTSLVIRISFQAPLEAGSYRSAWQAYNPSGETFGDPVFIDIIVTD